MISLRDLFAGLALLGLLINQEDETTSIGEHDEWGEAYSEAAYNIADAMMKLRGEKKRESTASDSAGLSSHAI
jgi:hypothetical protein